MKEWIANIKKHVLTGTSYMIPFIVIGGMLYSISVMMQASELFFQDSMLLEGIREIGQAGLELYIPALGAYTAYSMADKPGIAPGMIGAYLADQLGAGFLGGIVAGLIAGCVVVNLKKIKLPLHLKSLGSIFIYPIIGSFVTGMIILYAIGVPMAAMMDGMTEFLYNMSHAAKAPLAVILGSMTAFDMGGPVNKAATIFAQAQVERLPYLMGGVGIAMATPSLGMGLASLLAPKRYDAAEKQAGKAALFMGMMGISEGAIPFAAKDPVRVLPSIIIGSVAGNLMAFELGVLNHAPWGGLIVLPAIEGKLLYLASLFTGAIVTALMVNLLKCGISDMIEARVFVFRKRRQMEGIELKFEEL